MRPSLFHLMRMWNMFFLGGWVGARVHTIEENKKKNPKYEYDSMCLSFWVRAHINVFQNMLDHWWLCRTQKFIQTSFWWLCRPPFNLLKLWLIKFWKRNLLPNASILLVFQVWSFNLGAFTIKLPLWLVGDSSSS